MQYLQRARVANILVGNSAVATMNLFKILPKICREDRTMPPKPVAIRVQMPDSLRAKFKAQCALQGKTMNEAIIELMERWLAEASQPE